MLCGKCLVLFQVVKNIIKLAVKMTLLARNDMLSEADVVRLMKVQKQLHSLTLTIISFVQVIVVWSRWKLHWEWNLRHRYDTRSSDHTSSICSRICKAPWLRWWVDFFFFRMETIVELMRLEKNHRCPFYAISLSARFTLLSSSSEVFPQCLSLISINVPEKATDSLKLVIDWSALISLLFFRSL